MKKEMTIPKLMSKKGKGEKIIMVTAYDYPMAAIADACGVDIILVGDSLGMVVLGNENTMPVNMEDMLHHTRPVVRAAQRALVVVDMPYGSYHTGREKALENAIRLIKEGGADAIKIEGGQEMLEVVGAMCKMGIPVMGHIGLLPQTSSLWGGYHIQGRDETAAWALVEAAQALEEAGVFAITLECIASEVAAMITEKIDIPTIGIGSGPDCDGQVLVSHDLLGLTKGHIPFFVKKYAHLDDEITKAYEAFIADVRCGAFPDAEHSYPMDAEEAKKLY